MKKVLVTGVCGLIGIAVCRRLLDHPEAHEVRGLSRRRHSSDHLSEAALTEVPEAQFHEG